jgi:flavin reductase (DIM6/NTAB) family NADH-FMN oxidoreductase RutF
VTEAEERLADLLGQLDPALWILTVSTGEERAGCLIGFATQTSLDPTRFLACVSRVNHSFAPAMRAAHVAVHAAPDDDDLELATLFGEETGDDIDKFARCDWHEGPEGQAVLEGCPAWFVGRVEHRYDVGDHVGLLLEPVAVEGSLEGVLGFDRAERLDPGHPA